MNNSMFDGFIHKQIKTQETIINLVQGGSGDPILLLHGYPQTHVCWHRVAPILAETIPATNEEFRAAATIDLIHDEAEQEHRTTFDMLEVWRLRAENVQRVAFDCGHFCQRKIRNERQRTSSASCCQPRNHKI